jgi:hypothetical protein
VKKTASFGVDSLKDSLKFKTIGYIYRRFAPFSLSVLMDFSFELGNYILEMFAGSGARKRHLFTGG